MGTSKASDKKFIPQQKLSEQELAYRILFDFAHYLENMQRAPVAGATVILRKFLEEKNLYGK